MNNLNILYEDNHIIVVEKPINILSQKDNTNDMDMLTIIKEYIKIKYKKPGNVYLGLVHRLDRPVGGVMVFAKTSKAASRLSEQIRNHTFKKTYLAVVNGILDKKNDQLINYIEKGSNNTSYISDNGKYSKLEYSVLEEKDNYSLVKIDLETGRHHQIRLQFANIGHYLYGDQKYGIKNNKQLALYAYKLEFMHPVTKKMMIFENMPKKNSIWGIFDFFEN